MSRKFLYFESSTVIQSYGARIFGVDLEIVWNTICDDLPLLMDAVQGMVKGIE